ncbi:MAG: integrase [Desulfovibrionaceae bacterium CG1_02_65_16]|nr:MAG: integrase [Desulfovibrionaceae bacterium CG1_02_65_16]
MKLTDTTVKNAHAKEKQYTLYDEKGLFLLVRPNGSKLWRWKYRVDGKEKRLSLGVYPEVSLKVARETRDVNRVSLKAGTDPGASKQAAKAEERAQGETFELVAREWHKKFLPGWTPGHAARILVSLEKDAFPWLGVIPIHELTAPQVLAVARRVESRGALETAHRLVGNIGQVCRYAVACGMAEADPTASLRGALPPAIQQHHATITQPLEVGALLRAIDGYTGSFIVKCALRILPYVFTRPGELRGMEWSELELDGPSPTWTIPPARMKMRRKHLVPLAPQVAAVLKELQPVTGSGRLVFPGERTKERPISDGTLGAALRRLGYSNEELTPHGFRAMASTMLNEMNWPADHIERQLAHAEQSKVRGAYNHASYLADRRNMMLKWADYLDALRDGGKVVLKMSPTLDHSV